MTPHPLPRRLFRWSAILIAALLVVLTFDLYPGLRGGGGWQWTYEPPPSPTAVGLLVAMVIVYLIGAFWLREQRPRLTLMWTFLGAVLLTFAVVGVRGDVGFLLFTRTVSPVQTGGSALATRIFATEGTLPALQRWTGIMEEAYTANLIHFTTSPPGQPLLHQLLADAFDTPALSGISQPVSLALRPYQCSDPQVMAYTRGEIVSAGLGWLLPVIAALAVFPLYTAAVDLSGSPRAAQRMIVWWALIPTVALFPPTWNTVYPFLSVLSFALLVRGLLRRRVLYMLAAGAVMSLTTFLNFAVLPVLLLFGLFTLGYWWIIARRAPDAPGFGWAVVNGIWFAIGLLTVWVIFALVSGLTPLDLLRVTFTSHRDLVQRDALTWLILHPYDVALFVGFPLTVLAGWGIWQAARRSGQPSTLTPVDGLALATGLTVLLVNVVGIVQGENGRILAFYAPFLLLASLRVWTSEASESAGAARRVAPRWITPVDFPLLIVQGAALAVMAAVLSVIPLDLNPQPTGPRTDVGGFGESPAWLTSGAGFDSLTYAGAFRLEQYRYIGDPAAQAISFEFLWSGDQPTERPYQFELQATAFNELDGEITAEPFRWSPQGGNYLTPCWRAGDAVRDVVVLPLPPVSMPVVWEVTLSAVDARTGDLMQITAPIGETGSALPLEPVKYP